MNVRVWPQIVILLLSLLNISYTIFRQRHAYKEKYSFGVDVGGEVVAAIVYHYLLYLGGFFDPLLKIFNQ